MDGADTEPTMRDLAERQVKATERLLLLHQVVLFLAFVGLVLWGIALLGS